MRRLATCMQCQLPSCIIIDTDGDTRLHWIRYDPVVDKPKANDMWRRCHRSIDCVGIADLKNAGDVAGRLGPEGGCARSCGLRASSSSWPRRERDVDGFDSILGLIDPLGDDDRDRVAYVANALPSQRKALRCC